MGKQESLTNAKINAQQQCMYEGPQRRNLQQMNVRNTMLKVYSVAYNVVTDNTGLSPFV